MDKSPASIVKNHFGDKAKLVAALGPFTHDDLWTARLNEKKGLGRVSNAKLLRLFNLLSMVKEKFGNRFKLVDAICEIEKRAKDEGYKKRLLAHSVPRLFDLYRSAARRAGIAVDALPALSTRVPPRASDDSETPKAKATPAGGKPSGGGKAPAKKTAAKSSAAKGKAAEAKKRKG